MSNGHEIQSIILREIRNQSESQSTNTQRKHKTLQLPHGNQMKLFMPFSIYTP